MKRNYPVSVDPSVSPFVDNKPLDVYPAMFSRDSIMLLKLITIDYAVNYF